MKHRCRDCHFLAKEHGWQTGIMSYSLPWTEEERLEGKVTEIAWDNLCCKRGIWDQRIEPELVQKLEEVIDENRKGDCFFIEFSEGMSFEGATELHRIRHENRHLKRSYRFTLYGLIIASIGLVIGAIFQAASFFFK